MFWIFWAALYCGWILRPHSTGSFINLLTIVLRLITHLEKKIPDDIRRQSSAKHNVCDEIENLASEGQRCKRCLLP